MKKILSLLSMLMITVMAFATDYKGQLDYILTTRNGDLNGPSNAQGVLKIEDYAGGKYTVTATGCDLSSIDKDLGDWGEIICEGVEGTTDANGVTTINVTPYAFRGSDNAGFKSAKLFVKFKGDKAYATFEGTYNPNFYTNYKLKYTFGVDEGFDGGSTGGGETGGETSSIVTVKENFQSTEGSSWGENVTIDWTTQKLVVSVNLASTGSDKGFLGVTKKGQTAGWNNDGIIFYNTNGSTVQGYAPGQPNNANTDQVTKGEDPVRFEISKDGGVKCQGNVVISASNIAHLTNQSEIVVGAADKPAGALYNYIKVVPLNWTEVPPVTVVDTKEFKNVAYTTSMGGNGTATVTFTEMSDGTFPMTFVSDDLNVKAENLTKDTDAKGRTTYTGTAKRTDADVTFTVKAVVYTEGTEEKLYMTMDNGSSLVVTVGEDPDAPKVVATVPFTGVTLSASNGVTGTADVTFKEMSDETVQMTFNGAGYGISATNLTKGTDAKGRTTYTGQAVNDAASTVTYTVKAVVYTEGAEKKLYMTMVSVDGTTFTVGEDPDYVAPEPEIEGTVVEDSKNYAANGSKFEWSNIAINWNKQKLVAVIDLSSCTGTSENILSVGQNIGSWSIGGWHFYYTVASKKMKSDYLATGGAHPVSDPKTGVEPGTVRIELSKAEGCTIDGVSYNALYDSSVTGTWQSNTEDFWNLTSVNIGSKEGANRSNAVIKYVTVVDLPVTVKDEKTFNEALYMQDQKVADAKVVVKEMSDETVNKSLQFGENEYTSTELTKGTDEKNRTTYTGKVANGTQTYDVAGVVYEKDNAERLYMTMETGVATVVVGENPDAVTPEVTVTFEKQYADKIYSLASGTPNAMGDATVTLKEMSDNTVSMSLSFSGMTVESTDLVKGTDEKERTTYTGTAKFQGANYAVKAFRYTENDNEKLYMTLTTGTTVLAFGTDPDYVAPGDPEDVTLWENYQADGSGFSKTATIDWDKQKIVVSVDFSNGGDDKDILAMTTGESFAAFQTSTYRTMHWYGFQSDKQMSGFYAKSGSGNNNTGRMDVADCLAKFEISKAEGLKVNGEVKMSPVVLDELFASNTVLIGSGESSKCSQALYNYVKVVSLDWKEPTTPDTPEAVVYKNTLKVERSNGKSESYEDAKVSVLAKGNGVYEITLPKFSDLDGVPGEIGPVMFQANGVEEGGKVVLTATDQKFKLTNTGWTTSTANVSMKGEIADGKLKATFNVDIDSYSSYKFTLYYGVEPPVVVKEESNKTYTSNLRILDQTSEDTYLFQTDEASVNIIKYSDNTYKITLKNITLNKKTSDLVFTGAAVGTEVNPDEGGAVVTDETMVQATADAETQNFLGGAVSAQFMWKDVSATEIRMSFVLEGKTLSLGGEFNYEKKPETAINGIHAANGEAQFFTIDGVKLNKLQKGLNIVRTADGKVKKVLVK